MKILVKDFVNNPQKAMEIVFQEQLPVLNMSQPAHGKLLLTKKQEGCTLTGIITASILLTCTRCLNEFHKIVNIELDEDFIWGIEPVSNGKHGEITLEDCSNYIDLEGKIDISDLVEQYFTITVTSGKSLCHDTCHGISKAKS